MGGLFELLGINVNKQTQTNSAAISNICQQQCSQSQSNSASSNTYYVSGNMSNVGNQSNVSSSQCYQDCVNKATQDQAQSAGITDGSSSILYIVMAFILLIIFVIVGAMIYRSRQGSGKGNPPTERTPFK
jgi:ATP-dependent Zn protease